MRDTIVVKHDEAIVDRVEAKLGTDIADGDTLQGTMILQATDLHTEGVRAEIFTVGDQTGHDDSVSGSLAETTDPPFGSSQSRRVDFEFIGFWNVGGGSFKTLDVRPVTQLDKLRFAFSIKLLFAPPHTVSHHLLQFERNTQ